MSCPSQQSLVTEGQAVSKNIVNSFHTDTDDHPQ